MKTPRALATFLAASACMVQSCVSYQSRSAQSAITNSLPDQYDDFKTTVSRKKSMADYDTVAISFMLAGTTQSGMAKGADINCNGLLESDEVNYASLPAKDAAIEVRQNKIGMLADVLQDGYIAPIQGHDFYDALRNAACHMR